MADIWDGPPREGTRGGLEQFNFDSVRAQSMKDRECYLGHTVKIGVMGKFGRFEKNDWWTKKRDDVNSLKDEIQNVKLFEESMMQEALGLKPQCLLKGNSNQFKEASSSDLVNTSEKEGGVQGKVEPSPPCVTSEMSDQRNVEGVVSLEAKEESGSSRLVRNSRDKKSRRTKNEHRDCDGSRSRSRDGESCRSRKQHRHNEGRRIHHHKLSSTRNDSHEPVSRRARDQRRQQESRHDKDQSREQESRRAKNESRQRESRRARDESCDLGSRRRPHRNNGDY